MRSDTFPKPQVMTSESCLQTLFYNRYNPCVIPVSISLVSLLSLSPFDLKSKISIQNPALHLELPSKGFRV